MAFLLKLLKQKSKKQQLLSRINKISNYLWAMKIEIWWVDEIKKKQKNLLLFDQSFHESLKKKMKNKKFLSYIY